MCASLCIQSTAFALFYTPISSLQVPVEELRIQLAAHADALRARLVEVVNEDYDEFVSLSTKLVDVDSAVASLQEPLLEMKGRVEAAKATVASQAAKLHEGLQRRQAAAAARSLLELAQDAVHVMSKVEKLLAELPAERITVGEDGMLDDSQHEALEAMCRLLDRLCSEVSRLHFYAARGEDLAVVRQMGPRTERAAASLESELGSTLRVVLAAQNPSAMAVLLHAYSSLGRPEAAEAVVREELVLPVVGEAVSEAASRAADGDHSGAASVGSSGPSLAVLLPAVSAALREHVGPFLELAMSPAAGSQTFDFLGGSVLPEVLAAVDAACPNAYSPGLPDAFHANYLAVLAFLDDLETFCPTHAQVERLRASQAYVGLQKKWNLAVYFSLRYQDVATALEDTLTTTGMAPREGPDGQPGGFAYVATAAAWKALQSCTDAGIFLPPLADRFLRLVLQVVTRYSTWIGEGLRSAEGPDSNGTQAPQEEGAVAAEGRWGAGASAEQLVRLWRDIAALQAAIHGDLLQDLLTLVRGPDPADSTAGAVAEEAIVAAFADCSTGLAAAAHITLNAAADVLVTKCCEALKQLRGIVATFRMTARSPPTRPAQYAITILTPLRDFVAGPGAECLDSAGRATLARAVVDGVAMQYCQLASSTLSTVRKTESSLRRLKSRKVGGGATPEGGDAGAAPDIDKMIEMQLALDVAEFKSKAEECGVLPGELASLEELTAAVAPVDEDAEGAPGAQAAL